MHLRKICRFIWFTLSLFIFFSHLSAEDIFLESKASYFVPTDHKFRKIYSAGGLFGGEITSKACKNLFGWVSGEYFTKTGSSIGEQNHTKITIVPLGIGLKYFFSMKCADLYIGGGVQRTYMHIKDSSPYVIHHISKWGFGSLAKIGAIVKLGDHFFADFFTSYTYTKIDFHYTDHGKVTRHNANLSGWAFGLGFGYSLGYLQ